MFMMAKTSYITTASFLFCTFMVIQATVLCPTDWIPSEDSGTCFKSYREALTWSKARTSCQKDGGDLVKIISKTMNNAVTDACRDSGGYNYWIGLSDLQEEGVYLWTDGEEANYTNWGDGQPDNHHDTNATDQDCVAMDWANMDHDLWGDLACTLQLYYVCETNKTLESAVSTVATTFSTKLATSQITTLSTNPKTSQIKTSVSRQTSTVIVAGGPATAAAGDIVIPGTESSPIQTTSSSDIDLDNDSDYINTDPTTSGGLSTGVIAAIVVACAVVFVLPAAYLGIRYTRGRHVHKDELNDIVNFMNKAYDLHADDV